MAKAKAALDGLKNAGGDVKINFDANTASLARATVAADAWTAATGRGTRAAGGFWRAVGIAHNILTVFGANIIADTIGIIAFGIGAVAAIAPVVEVIKNLGAGYGDLNNYQKAATVQLTNFKNQLMQVANPGIFAVITGGLALIGQGIGHTGGIMDQATIAFENFIAMLRQSFSSAPWAQLFSRSAGIIQKDLTALFGLINALINVIPALFHDFNGLGLFVISFATGILHLIAVIGNLDPSLVRFAAIVFLVYRALNMLGQFRSGSMLMTALAPMAENLPKLTGIMANFREFGLLPTLGMLSLAAPVATAAAAAFVVVGGGLLALALISRNAVNPMQAVINNMRQQDNATGANIAGYEKLSQDLKNYAQANDLVASKMMLTGNAALAQADKIHMVDQAQQQAQQTAQTLSSNLGYLEQKYHLTQEQAFQLAQKTGTNLFQAFAKGGGAAQQMRMKIQAYEQTVQAAQNPTTELGYDLSLAANKALGLTDRVTALTNAFNALLTPFANVIADTVTWKDGNISLKSAVDKAHGVVNDMGNRVQRYAAQQLSQAITNTVNLSQATLQQTGSMSRAMGPVEGLIGVLEHLGSKSKEVAQAIRYLQAYINSLHGKQITITTYMQTIFTQRGGPPTRPGYASGTQNAPPGMAWVGERGPELMQFRGGEKVIPHAASMSMAGSGQGGRAVELQPINIYLDGQVIYKSVEQRVYGKNMQNGMRNTHGSAQGRFGVR